MKHTQTPLIALLGLFLMVWYLVTILIGFGPNPLVRILVPLILAGLIWLVGAALVVSIKNLPTLVVLVAGLLVLATLILVRPVFFEHEPWVLPAYLANDLIGSLLSQLLPCLGLIVSAILLAVGIRRWSDKVPQSQNGGISSMENVQPAGRLIAVASLVLGVLILAGGLYHFYWLSLWDNTYDSLGVIYLFLPILAILFASTLLAALLNGKRQWLGLGYAGLAMTLTILVFLSAKAVDYRDLTEARAERIAWALEAYHTRHGTYPESLHQLTPWTMLSISEPVILHGQGWCYQAERDAYRLGFVDREHWSSPELFTTIAQSQGSLSQDTNICAAEISQLKAIYPEFYGILR